MRLRLELAYDGTGFAGWAIQPGLRTVQGVLEAALGTVLRTDGPPRVTVAGRTDSGVHARGQVAHVDIPAGLHREEQRPLVATRSDEVLLTRLGGILPSDLVVHTLTRAPRASTPGSPRCAAATPTGSATTPPGATRCPARTSCGTAAGSTSTRWRPRRGRWWAATTSRRTASRGRVRRRSARSRRSRGRGPSTGPTPAWWSRRCRRTRSATRWCARSSARAWPWGRGAGRRAGRRSCSPPGAAGEGVHVVAAHGLTLEEVGYPPDEELAARAVQTRARRAAEDLQHAPAAATAAAEPVGPRRRTVGGPPPARASGQSSTSSRYRRSSTYSSSMRCTAASSALAAPPEMPASMANPSVPPASTASSSSTRRPARNSSRSGRGRASQTSGSSWPMRWSIVSRCASSQAVSP